MVAIVVAIAVVAVVAVVVVVVVVFARCVCWQVFSNLVCELT